MSLSKEHLLMIDGPIGQIESKINYPKDIGLIKGVVIIAHPHPLQGGTMENKVVQTVARAAVETNFVALRFNFRGVGASKGRHDKGVGEIADMVHVREALPTIGEFDSIILAGFSFGSYIAAKAFSAKRADGLILIAPAVGYYNFGQLASKDTLIIHGSKDEVVPLSSVFDWAEGQEVPLTIFPRAGHFFHGMIPPLKGVIKRYIKSIV